MKIDKFRIGYPFYPKMFLRFGGIVFLLLGIYLSSLSFSQEYLQVIPIILGVFFLIFGIMCFAESFSYILIDSNGIKQKNLIKEIHLKKADVAGFAEIPLKDSKGITDIELMIFGKDKKKIIKINKGVYNENYKPLMKRLRREYYKVGIEYQNLIIKRRQKLGKAIGQGFGIILILSGFYQLLFINAIPRKSLYELTGKLKENPTIEIDRKGRIPSISFQLLKHNEVNFRASGEVFRMLHQNSFQLKKNDSVTLLILKSDYLQKLTKSELPEAENKYVNWDIVKLYGLVANNQLLLDYKEINQSRSNSTFKLLLIICGLGTFLYYRFISKGTY